MLNKLTKQERVLIITLLTVIIWAVGIMFVIKPNIEENSEMKTKLETAEQEKIEVDNKIASEPTIKANIADAKKELYATLDAFFPATENYDVDQYIMKLWQKSGLTIQSVTISDAAVSTLDHYDFQKSELQYPLGDYAKTQRQGLPVGSMVTSDATAEGEATVTENTEGAAETVTNESCEVITATIAVKGTQAQIRDFVNAASHDAKTLLVSDLSASEGDDGWSATVGISFIAVDKYDG